MYRNSRQSWILDYTPWIPDSRYWIPTSVSRTFWIQIVSGIADTLSCFPDSTTKFSQDSGFYKQKFLYSEIPIPLHGATSEFSGCVPATRVHES